MNMKLITTEKFGDLNCNFYRNINGDNIFVRRIILLDNRKTKHRTANNEITLHNTHFHHISVK